MKIKNNELYPSGGVLTVEYFKGTKKKRDLLPIRFEFVRINANTLVYFYSGGSVEWNIRPDQDESICCFSEYSLASIRHISEKELLEKRKNAKNLRDMHV